MASASSNLSGYAGTKLVLTVNQSSQDQANNTTTFSWSLALAGNYGGSDSSSDNTNWGIEQPDNSQFSSGNYGYYRVQNTNSLTIASGTRTVGHNSDGTLTTSFGGTVSVFAGTASVSLSITASTINRYAAITTNTATPSDIDVSVRTVTDVTCDLLETSLDGAAYVTSFSGDFTDKTVTLGGNLTSGAAHTVVCRVRRKDSQLKTTGSTLNFTTITQNNFMGILND